MDEVIIKIFGKTHFLIDNANKSKPFEDLSLHEMQLTEHYGEPETINITVDEVRMDGSVINEIVYHGVAYHPVAFGKGYLTLNNYI